jgi:predicted amidohydrolase YtcJ
MPNLYDMHAHIYFAGCDKVSSRFAQWAGAAAMGRLDRGALEPGKLADFIVLDCNPMTIPVGEIHQTKVLTIYLAEEKVFSAPAGETK